MGAVLALLGCLLGNLLSVCIMISQQENIAMLSLISRLTPGIIAEIMKVTFHPMDVLFYAIAVYEGYKFSFRPIGEEELLRLAMARTEPSHAMPRQSQSSA